MHFMITIDEHFLKESDTLLKQELCVPLDLPLEKRGEKKNGEEFVFVALFLGQVTGTMILNLQSDKAELQSAAIGTPYQGTGVGRKLFEQVLNYVKRKEIKSLDVYAINNSEVFWEKLGFEYNNELDHESFNKLGISYKKMVKVID